MNWKNKFQKHILERGYNYTYNVKNVKKTGNLVEATVSGSKNYTVKINTDDYSMSCTCPYFERANCKHIAAVLYYLEEERENIDVSFESSDDIEELFDTVKTEDKLDFLLKLLNEDNKLSNRFRYEFSKSIDRQYYIQKLSHILLEDDFDYELSKFVKNDMKLLFELKEYDLLINLLKSSTEAVFDEMSFDDYYWGGGFYTFEDIFKALLETSVRSKLFDMISWHLYFYCDVYGLESFVDFYASNFTDNEELEEKLDVIDEILVESDVYETKLVLMKIETMKLLSKSSEEINEFREKYSDLKEIRQLYIDEAVEDEDYEEAIKLVKKELKRDLPPLFKKDYENQLKDLYLKCDDSENYKKQLKILLFSDYPRIEDYIEYKKLSDNWTCDREEIFAKISSHTFLNQCYCHEKLYDRLLLNLRNEYDLCEYKNVLKDYPSQLLEIYLSIVNELVLKSGTRKHYRHIVKLLKDMKSLDGGSEVVDDLISNWKIKYKRRTAMLEELGSL